MHTLKNVSQALSLRGPISSLASDQVSVLVRELEAAHWASAMVVQPLADALVAIAVTAGQVQQLCGTTETLHADVTFFVNVQLPGCSLPGADATLTTMSFAIKKARRLLRTSYMIVLKTSCSQGMTALMSQAAA